MKLFAYTLTIITLLLSACNGVKSGLYIPAYQQFVLGEDESSAFRVELQNQSPYGLNLETRDQENNKIASYEIGPQSKTNLSVPANQNVVISNPNDKTVKVLAKLNKGVQGMRYEVIEEAKLEKTDRLSPETLEPMLGDNWRGKLIYANSQKDQMLTSLCKLDVKELSKGRLQFEFSFPDDDAMNGEKQKLTLSSNGKQFGGRKIVLNRKENDFYVLKTLEKGVVEGKEAAFFYTYRFKQDQLILKEEYQLRGDGNIKLKKEYNFTRS